MQQPPLEAQQLITTNEDYRTILPMQLSRAEVKILYALLLARSYNDEERRGQPRQMHEALLAKLHYYLTNNSSPTL